MGRPSTQDSHGCFPESDDTNGGCRMRDLAIVVVAHRTLEAPQALQAHLTT